MREIKFRGKRTDNGEMWYGDLSHHTTGKVFIKDIKKGIKGTFEVVFNTIGQFTGLYDKNGKEIYEGDIIQMKDRLVEVTWHEKVGCWDCIFLTYTSEPDKEFSLKGLGKTSWWKMYEVIGNIYDNSEFIKE